MKRYHLFEFEDQPWFPAMLRDCMTDLLNYQLSTLRVYDAIVPLLRQGLSATGATEILDLCSGGGGVMHRLRERLARAHGVDVRVRLSDKYPNIDAFRRAEAASGGAIGYIREPVDATAVPGELKGFRTLFTSFHHFPPDAARRVLQDAVDKRSGIGVFEFTERSLLGLASIALSPGLTMAATPFIRPLRASRFFFTYAFPVVTAAYFVDGIASSFRTYTPDELREMTASLSGPPYRWEIGQVWHGFMPMRLTYAVGYPV